MVPAKGRDPLLAFVATHPALAVTGLTALIFIIRIMSAARFDPAVAAALVAHSGAASVISGVAVSSGPLLLVALSTYLLAAYQWTRQDGPHPSLLWAGGAAMLGFVLLAPLMAILIGVPAGVVGVLASMLVLRWRVDPLPAGSRPAERDRWIFAALGMTTLLAFLFAGIGGDLSWLSAEDVHLKDGTQQTAFVLASEGTWTALLLNEPRVVEWVATSDIVHRQPCRQSRKDLIGEPRSLLGWLSGEAPLPACPVAASGK